MANQKILGKTYILYSILIIILITFAVRASNNMMMTTISLFAQYDLFFNKIEVGLTESAMALSTFIATALVNSRLNPGSRRILFIISNIAFTIILGIMQFSNYVSFWAFIFIAGFAFGAIMPNIMTSAGMISDKKIRERVLGIYTLSLSVSLIAGPAFESYILNFYHLREIFLFFVPLGIVSAILSPFLKFPYKKDEAKSKKIKIFSEPGFRVAIFAIFAYNIVFALLITFGGIYARSILGFSYSDVALLFTGFFIVSFSSRMFFSIRTPENLWHYLFTAMSVTLIGVILLFFGYNDIIYIVAYLMLGVPHGVTYPLSLVSISRTFGMSYRNTANSYFFSVMMFISIIIPALGGIMENMIGFRYMFLILVPVIILLIILSNNNFKKISLWKSTV